MMGASLQVKSTLGEGSVFGLDLDLPEVDQEADVAEVDERHIIGFKGSKRKVLVVDDNWTNRSVLSNLLQPLGFEVLEATNGEVSGVRIHESGFTSQDSRVGGKAPGIVGDSQLIDPESMALPAEELEVLVDLAMRGDIRGMIEQSSHLEVLDAQWLPLATHLRQLAQGFIRKTNPRIIKQYEEAK